MSASLDLKSKEEKDAELDKRIEALRRKNQALIKRYQEIEEDRKKAEQEGIAVTGGRRSRSDEGDAFIPERRRGELDSSTLTVQVLLSPEEKRVVSNERRHSASTKASRSASQGRGSFRGAPYPGSRSPRGECLPDQPVWKEGGTADPGAGKRGRGGGGGRGGGRGQRSRGGQGGPAGEPVPDRRSKEWEERRRQNIEKMNEEMEKIAEYERSQRDGAQEKNPVRNFLDDPRRSGTFAESDRREGSRRHMRNWGGPDFDKVKTGMEQGKERPSPGRGSSRRRGGPSPPASLDMTLSMTGRERAEYIRWKQEREQIDQERLARHRQPTGEWRREWDAEKMDAAFKEGSKPGGSVGGKHGESKRPPKLPTFGEFLSEQQPDRRRRGRGRSRGHQRNSAPSKPYSMHDNRWEKEEPDQAPPPAPVEEKSAIDTVQQAETPASSHTLPEEEEVEGEEEDQWEDVSGGEEEEEQDGDEAGSNDSQGSAAEDEKEKEQPSLPPSTSSSHPPGRNGQLSLAMPPPQEETPNTEGKPLTPFSPAEGYHPVSDWGEEMELSSPRADLSKSPLSVSQEGPSPSAGMSSPNPPAGSGSLQLSMEVSEREASPAPRDPEAEMSKKIDIPNPDREPMQEEAGNQGAAAETSAPAPTMVEITDFQREQQED
ncbi:coiled-coil domain-containing protein 9 isoform X2 [Sceloporus undulatus]|uniref:coiled-coil domain-containing protein 9 isoform X2 n=1 Tax=Sceloporus undulatus TaxID=8520 RepID=UPI001C4B49FE|nr:coiled-coil domain-containing protein 9 isoform X2 [Sceloporus undulatus]